MHFIERYFKFKTHQTTLKTEIVAGITTFLTMIYIIVVNSELLAETGMHAAAVVTSTVIVAAFSSFAMGLYARNPYAVAPAMGMNVFFVYTIVKTWGISWQVGLGAVTWSGILFFLMTILNIRAVILNNIPDVVKYGMGAGIGIFITVVGFHNAGFIEVSTSSGLFEVAKLTTQSGIFLVCFFVLSCLLAMRVKASMLIVIILGCCLSYPFGRWWGHDVLLTLPEHYFAMPDFSQFFEIDWTKSFSLALFPTILTFLFINLFDSSGTLIGLAQSSQALDEEGNPIRMKQSLVVDSLGSACSGLLGTSPVSIYVESATGIMVGGRTGLVACVVGLCFLPFLFLSPIVTMVPMFVVAPILVIVGSFMMYSIRCIEWSNIVEAIPAFATIVLMPLTMSISEGIAWGMLTWFFITLMTDYKKLNIINLK